MKCYFLKLFCSIQFFSDCKAGNIDKVLNSLGNDEIKIDETDYKGRNGLHYSTMGGHFELTIILTEKGLDINITDNEGQTPLMIAAKDKNMELTKFFIEKMNINEISELLHKVISSS